MSDVIDLDALVPQAAKVKFDDEILEIPPPKTGDILMMGNLFKKVREDDLSENELNSRLDQLTAHIYKMIPMLNSKPLSTAQLIKVVNILDTMALPPDSEKGITVDNPKKA